MQGELEENRTAHRVDGVALEHHGYNSTQVGPNTLAFNHI